MHVNLKPLSPHCAVMEADDPYKKYWWVILLGCAFTALWLLMPMLGEQAIGSTSVDAGKPKTDADVEQTLAAGDAGSGVDLSMDGTGKKKKADGMTGSMLYQVVPGDELNPEPAAAAGASASAGGSLANELAKVSRQSGGWGEKAQRGFNAPRLAGSSLSGMGAASGGRAGGISGSGAFGTRNAQVGFAATKSLSGGAGEDAPESKGLAALKTAADLSESAVANRSNDAATTSLNRAFDGAKGQNQIGGDKSAALGGNYAALDAAPANLKLNDPKLSEKKLKEPPASDVGGTKMDDSQMAKQLAMSMVGIVIGGAIGGVAGGIVTQVVQQAVQRQMDQEAKVRELEQKQQLDDAKRRMGART